MTARIVSVATTFLYWATMRARMYFSQNSHLVQWIVLTLLVVHGGPLVKAQGNSCLCLPVTNVADKFNNDGGYWLDTCSAPFQLPHDCNSAYKQLYLHMGYDSAQGRIYATESWDIRFHGRVFWDSIVVCSWEHPNVPAVRLTWQDVDSNKYSPLRDSLRSIAMESGGMILLAVFYDSGYDEIIVTMKFQSPVNIKSTTQRCERLPDLVTAGFDGTVLSWIADNVTQYGDLPNDADYHLFPNPSTALVHIQRATGREGPAYGQIESVTGSVVSTIDLGHINEDAPSKIQVDLTRLRTGMYFVRIGSVRKPLIVLR
jgi:hypothetical protein